MMHNQNHPTIGIVRMRKALCQAKYTCGKEGNVYLFAGPTSLIQFKIWLCGTVDEQQLEELLIQSTRHAVCDIILEYQLLTAPICEVPPHYCKGVLSPMHSAPVSPQSSTPTGTVC